MEYTEAYSMVEYSHCPKCSGCGSMTPTFCEKPECHPEVQVEHLHHKCTKCGYQAISLCLDALKKKCPKE